MAKKKHRKSRDEKEHEIVELFIKLGERLEGKHKCQILHNIDAIIWK